MAAFSVSISRDGQSDPMNPESTAITYGVLAPGAGDVEIRVSAAAIAAGISLNELENTLDLMWRGIYGHRPAVIAI